MRSQVRCYHTGTAKRLPKITFVNAQSLAIGRVSFHYVYMTFNRFLKEK